MRKLFIMVIILSMAIPCYADTITFDNITSYNDLTVPVYNSTLNKLYNKINTSIDSENITNQTIQSEDISTAVSPLVRDQENIGEYVYTGLTLPSTGAASAGTITAGTAYVSKDDDATLHRVVTSTSAAMTTFVGYTANQDNWVYLDYAGSFSISAVGIGAAQPSNPANSIVLGHVEVDSGGDIQSADETARQTTPPSLRIYQDFITGLFISRDATDTDIINVGRGTIDLGSGITLRRNTATIDIDFDVDGEGGLADADTYTGDSYYYLYVYADGSNETNYKGIAGSSTAGVADVTGERLIGWCFADSTPNISPDSCGGVKIVGSGQPNIVTRIGTDADQQTSKTITNMNDMDCRFYTSGRPMKITFNAPISGAAAGTLGYFHLSADTTGLVSGQWETDTGDEPVNMTLSWGGILEPGTHTITVQWSENTGSTLYSGVNAQTENIGARVLTVQEI